MAHGLWLLVHGVVHLDSGQLPHEQEVLSENKQARAKDRQTRRAMRRPDKRGSCYWTGWGDNSHLFQSLVSENGIINNY